MSSTSRRDRHAVLGGERHHGERHGRTPRAPMLSAAAAISSGRPRRCTGNQSEAPSGWCGGCRASAGRHRREYRRPVASALRTREFIGPSISDFKSVRILNVPENCNGARKRPSMRISVRPCPREMRAMRRERTERRLGAWSRPAGYWWSSPPQMLQEVIITVQLLTWISKLLRENRGVDCLNWPRHFFAKVLDRP